ncbi:MAG: hypothetical protein IPP61_19490 [Cytophagaceae bacterium]|nr:hypothetical protein [Cytophagaceae bacterium]
MIISIITSKISVDSWQEHLSNEDRIKKYNEDNGVYYDSNNRNSSSERTAIVLHSSRYSGNQITEPMSENPILMEGISYNNQNYFLRPYLAIVNINYLSNIEISNSTILYLNMFISTFFLLGLIFIPLLIKYNKKL